MHKILTTILFLIFSLSFVSAQTETTDTTLSKLPNYSESIPYQPRENPAGKNSKPKKEKKSKKPVPEGTFVSAGSELKTDQTMTIPVSVFDANGRFVMNLGKTDFKVFADGKEQEILAVAKRSEPVNIVLLIDTSPSTAFRIEEIQNYAQAIVGQLKPEDKVMVIAFNAELKALTELTADRQITAKAIRKLKFGDGTSLYEAVKTTFDKYVSQISGLKTVILLTDGVDTTSRRANYADSLTAVEQVNTAVFPIYFDTFTKDVKKAKNNPNLQSILNTVNFGTAPGLTAAEYELGRFYLNDISQLSGGRARQVKDINDVRAESIGNIGAELRVQYQISFRPTDFTVGQRKQITVRVNRPGLTVQARGSLIAGGSNQMYPSNQK